MRTYAIDWETSYATGRDIGSLGVVPYLSHKATDLYLVAIYGEDVDYCGPIEGAPWALIDGQHWVAHNAAFDAACFMECIRRGQIPAHIAPVEFDCTANLCTYLSAPRSLAKAAKELLGVTLDKSTRDAMKGKTWATMSEEFKAECIAYAKIDAQICYRLWSEYHKQWPAEELAISRHTTAMCLGGIAVDLTMVEGQIATLTSALWTCEQKIPWASELTAKGKEIPILSAPALKAHCVKVNLPPPLTTADKSPIFEAWMDKYEEQAPFVGAVKSYRSINRTLEILKKFRDQTQADGRLRYSLKYFGAHTGRFSGDSGLNFQNITKEPLCFDAQHNKLPKGTKAKDAAKVVDLRGCLIPGPGKKFVVADLSQIEARVALWFADDQVQLGLIRSGLDLYEAHARSQMGYNFAQALKDYCEAPDTPAKDKNLRQFAKCRVLGLGFGLGFKKFVLIVMQWAGITITEAEAKRIVDDYRAANPGIIAIWKKLDRALRGHALRGKGEPFGIELPSWRSLQYFDINASDDVTGRVERGGLTKYFYGGLLFENLVQATARDILVAAILRIEAAGYSVVLHVHDEVIVEVPADLQGAASIVGDLMTAVPDWAEGLPIGCSAKETNRYFK